MIHTTLDCVRPTQFSVIQIIHRNVDLKCFFSILQKCVLVIIVLHAYFIRISQGSVETHLRCGGMYNNKCTKYQFIHLLTATFKDLHIENSKNYKR